MNPDSQNFDTLRRALALKRHEQPPPGYFDRFSRDVMARIKAGETGGETDFELSWMRRLLAMFDVKPVFAGAFGVGVCALLITGVVTTESSGPVVASSPNLGERNLVADQVPATPPEGPVIIPANSNAVADSLFQQFQPQVNTEPVSKTIWVPNGN